MSSRRTRAGFVPLMVSAAVVTLVALGCNELKEPLPTGPSPVPPPPPSPFQIVGHWEASTTQGRSISFDVTADGQLVNGRINLHHDCNTGRWRVTFTGFESWVVDSAFLTTFDWKNIDQGVERNGTLTISGRFESDNQVRGGLINSVNDVRTAAEQQPTGDVCPSIQASYEGTKGS